jgi:hypothetical protein
MLASSKHRKRNMETPSLYMTKVKDRSLTPEKWLSGSLLKILYARRSKE